MHDQDTIENLRKQLHQLTVENQRLRAPLAAADEKRTGDSEEWLRLALDSARMGTWSLDLSSETVQWSAQTMAMYGVPPGRVVEKFAQFVELVHPDDRAAVRQVVEGCVAGDARDFTIVHRTLWPDGSSHWIEGRGRLHRDADGRPRRMTGTVVDISERRSGEEQSRASREQLRSVLDTVPDFICTLDRDGRIRFINRVGPGVTMEQVLGSNALDWVVAEQRPAMAAAMARAYDQEEVCELETRGSQPGENWYLSRIGPLKREGRVVALTLVITEITTRKRVELALRESEARLRAAADSLPFAFWVRDGDGRTAVQNAASIAQFGDQIGKRVEDLGLPPALLAQAQAHLRQAMAGEVVNAEVTVDLRGEQRWLQLIIAPVRDGGAIRGVLGVDIDITERRRLEEQLFQAAKVESIGRLAGGVAHDFNNLLTTILGFSEMAARTLAAEAPARVHLRRVAEAAERGAALTRQLLAFARKQVIRPQLVDLGELVRRTGMLLPRLIGEDVELKLDLTAPIRPVTVDPTQFEQILLNLAVNARDAMPGGGRLTIAVAEVALHASDLRGHDDVAVGDFVRLDVRDTGAGMEPDVLRRIFEPFFTTKPVGKGTGLGLAMCHGIVKQSGGHIVVASELGQGTTFSIFMPAAPADHG